MKKYLIYLAPSILFKTRANTIQSLCQFNSFYKYFNNYFYVCLTPLYLKEIKKIVKDSSNLKFIPKGIVCIRLLKFFSRETFNAIFQFIFCLIIYIKIRLENNENELYIYSRSLLASFLLSIFHVKHSFEFHNLENNFLLSFFQKYIFNSKKVSKIFISKKLKDILSSKYSKKEIRKFVIAPDSSPKYLKSDLDKVILEDRLKELLFEKSKIKCVYSGSSGEGRGVDLVLQIAKKLKNINFIFIGDFIKNNKSDSLNNIFIAGSKSHLEAMYIMSFADIGLMPYQKNLSMGRFKVNSIDYMSPLKMFDYMNSNLLIVASHHKVLEEILENNETCVFIDSYENKNCWIEAIKKIDNYLINRIGENAKKVFDSKYNYNTRTEMILRNLIKV